jgi:hypothetical protein
MPTAVLTANMNITGFTFPSRLLSITGEFMENFKKFAPVALLALLVVKGVALGITMPQAVAIVALAALVFGMESAEDSKRIEAIKKQQQDEINELKAKTEAQQKEISEIRGYVTSVKLGTQYNNRRA